MTSFRDLHVPGSPLLLPNPWDAGSAKVFASLGFSALATTSSGYAATLGRPDQAVTRDEAVAHAAAIVAATPLPVSADLENGFADDAPGVEETYRLAAAAGLAGGSIEDVRPGGAAYPLEQAVERVAAARSGAGPAFVLTARCEDFLYGREDLAAVVTRLQAFSAAGADVLYAPGVVAAADIRTLVAETDRPVNVLAMPGVPAVAELADLGVARISVGGALFYVGLDAVAAAGRQFLAGGYGYADASRSGRAVARQAFG